MINGLYKIREELHNRILVDRSIESIILRHNFERLWGYSETEEKDIVRKCVKEGDKRGIIKWMREHPSIDIGEKPLRDLYPIAKKLRITNYSRLLRDDLIIAIKKAEAASVIQQGIHAGTNEEESRTDVQRSHLLQGEEGSSSNTGECPGTKG